MLHISICKYVLLTMRTDFANKKKSLSNGSYRLKGGVFFVLFILKEDKHNASEPYRELKSLAEGTSVFSTHKATINTINAIFTGLL